ncbi:DNA polymerase [Streptomyces sp. NPDC001941]|uniref:DNA polymerase n=1 Tax=Streptomyces sp. NPDC001941 TaxID=3154659 RepID=UPI00332AE4A1
MTVHVVENADDCETFKDWAREKWRRGLPVAFDQETTGLDIYAPGYRCRLAQFGDETTAYVLPVELGEPFRDTVRSALRNLPELVIHNAPFDWLVADRHLGVTLEHLYPRTVDTKILATLIDPRQVSEGGVGTGLKPLAAALIDPDAPDTQEGLTAVFRSLKLTKATGWAGVRLDHPTYELYAGLDVLLTSRLLGILRGKHAQYGIRPALVEYEHRIAMICASMQRVGMVLDVPYAQGLDGELAEEAEKNAALATRYGVENVNSTRQVAEALAGMGEVLTERTASGAVKVDKAVMLALADRDLRWERTDVRTPNPLAEAVLRSKRAGKWRSAYASTFLETVDAGGRVHPTLSALQARTGRMSIARPALQTLPSSDQMIRRALLADEGHVICSTDFQAVELRVLAALADVRRMKAAIAAGEDLHGYTASLVYGPGYTPTHRKICKGLGFGKVYGGGAETIARQTGAPYDEVVSALRAYDRVYPEVKRASSAWQREARGNGYVTETVTGRRLPLDRDRTYAVVNYQVQSAARDVLGQALVNMHDADLLPYLRLPIHDEVVCSFPREDAAELAREVERCMTFDLYGVPITAEAEIGGRSWGSLYGSDY